MTLSAPQGEMTRRAVFLDRDGTINVEKDYLYRVEDFEFLPGAIEAIRALKQAGFLVVVVTNQSGVGRGYYRLEDVENLHRHLQQELQQSGAGIDAFYVCPHHPREAQGEYLKDCDCRKGRPGMLLQAAAELAIDFGRSFMVGDKLADVEAGERAGCRSVLVRTGYGREEEQLMRPGRAPVCDDLTAAVEMIMAELNSQGEIC